MDWTVLQHVLYCHWRCDAEAQNRMSRVELGEHVMSEYAVACPQSHNNHLVFSRKQVVWILSVVIRMLLRLF